MFRMQFCSEAYILPAQEGWFFGGNVMSPGWRAVVRMAFWCLSIFVSIFPALHESHVRPSIHLEDMASEVNAAGFFRDFFFVTIVVAIVSFSNLIDSMMASMDNISNSVKGIACLLCVYFIYVLVYGVSRFTDLAGITAAISPDDFAYDFRFIEILLAVSFFTELAISAADDAYRPRDRRRIT